MDACVVNGTQTTSTASEDRDFCVNATLPTVTVPGTREVDRHEENLSEAKTSAMPREPPGEGRIAKETA
jgi:hypothetical protein